MIFFKTRNRRKLESHQVRASNHTYVRPYTLYSAENAEGREIGGRSYSRLHRFLNLFGGRNRGEGGDRSFRICPIENLSDARGVPSNLSLSPGLAFTSPFPTWICFIHLFPSPVSFLYFQFYFPLRRSSSCSPLFCLLLFLSPSSTAFIDNFSITRVGKKRNILYTKFVATRLEMVKNSATVGHCSPQLSKFVGKFLFQIEGDKEKTGGSL